MSLFYAKNLVTQKEQLNDKIQTDCKCIYSFKQLFSSQFRYNKYITGKGFAKMGLFSNRKKKKQQDEFFQLFGDALKTANDNIKTIGKVIFDSQSPDRSDFGRCDAHPIFTNILSGTESYLSRLCTKDGNKFTWSGYTSIKATVCGHEDICEDVYTLYLNGEKYTDIYVVHYVDESKFPPAGLYFCDDDTDWDLEREAFGKGFTATQLILLREIENEKLTVQKELHESIAKKSAHINSKYTDFSIDVELQNPDFVFLSSFDIDALTVYEYCHKEELLFKKITTEACDIENLNTEFYFNILHDIEKKEWQQYLRDNKKSNEDLQRDAASNDIRFDDFLMIRRMEEENAEIKRKLCVKKLRTAAEQAIEVQRNYSKFDLSTEWKNTTFREITTKLGMFTAYEIIHFNECYYQEQKEEPVSTPINVETSKLFCRRCGTELFTDSFFCHKCGTTVIK